MRLPAWAWLALTSLICFPLAGETRPRYGGTLTVEESLFDVLSGGSLSIPVTETLVRMDSSGQAQAVLAVAWQHDPDFKRWRFSLRPKVVFHDGQPLTAAAAAPSLLEVLKQKYPDISIEAGGQALLIKSGQPMPNVLELLASAGVSRTRNEIGTGPFRIASREERRTIYAAFEDYWGGRPYLDSVILEDSSARGRPDMIDLPAGPQRRIVPEGWTTWSSAPKMLVALDGRKVDVNLLKALALAIDRAPIANVLAQHKADPAFGLLPQWLSGYAFLFESAPDVARAKQVVAQLHPAPMSMEAPSDPFLRSVAERIALNARDAGLVIQFKPAGDLRLLELPIDTTSAGLALESMRLGDRLDLDLTKPEALYQFERTLIEEHHLIPLVHLRKSFAISPKVHVPQSRDQFSLDLADTWVEP